MNEYDYLLTASIPGTVQADTLKEAFKLALEDCNRRQKEIDESNLRLIIKLEIESLQKVYD